MFEFAKNRIVFSSKNAQVCKLYNEWWSITNGQSRMHSSKIEALKFVHGNPLVIKGSKMNVSKTF